MEQSEEWRPVVGWETYYEVSNLGRVRSIRTSRMLLVSPSSKGGSYRVSLCRPNKMRTIARLVVEAFIGSPPQEGMCVYHKDENLANNRVDNLYWDKRHPYRRDIEKSIVWRRTEEGRAVYRKNMQIRLQDPNEYEKLRRTRKVICVETGVIYPSEIAAATAFGLNKASVQCSCKTAGPKARCVQNVLGKPVFHFRYYNPEDWRPKERIWRPVPIPELKDKYEVSNMGEIRNILTQRILKTSFDKGNRSVHVSLCGNGKVRNYRVSHLVAGAFLHKQYGMSFVRHRDGDLSNNCITNLVWSNAQLTYSSPISKAHFAGGRKPRSVVCVETGVSYASISDAATAIGVCASAIKHSCERQLHNVAFLRHQHIGKPVYHFRYADQ